MPITIERDRFKNLDIYEVNLHRTEIEVTFTADSTVVLHHRELKQKRIVVGLGVQWTFYGNDSPGDTLQLCIGRRCLIFQLFHTYHISKTLRKFLRNPNFTFVGFWNNSDRRKLESSAHRLEMCRDPIDLRYHVVAEKDDGDVSINEIVEKCLGYNIEREQRREIFRSEWDNEYLSRDQVVFACIDAYCAFRIGKNIKAWRFIRWKLKVAYSESFTTSMDYGLWIMD